MDAVSQLTRVKRSTTRIQKRANARHCRLKFIEFRLVVWNEVKESAGSKVSRNTYARHVPPATIHFPVSRNRRANRQITFEPVPSGTLWYTIVNRTVSTVITADRSHVGFRFCWAEDGPPRLFSQGRRLLEEQAKGARSDSESPPIPTSIHECMDRKVDDCLIKFERKFLFLVSASEAGWWRDELSRYPCFCERISYDSWKDNTGCV